jgi:hypothetical protein
MQVGVADEDHGARDCVELLVADAEAGSTAEHHVELLVPASIAGFGMGLDHRLAGRPRAEAGHAEGSNSERQTHGMPCQARG